MAWVAGIECDVSSPASVQRLMSAAASQMGSVDVWINNAGNSGSFQVLHRPHLCVHVALAWHLLLYLLIGPQWVSQG